MLTELVKHSSGLFLLTVWSGSVINPRLRRETQAGPFFTLIRRRISAGPVTLLTEADYESAAVTIAME